MREALGALRAEDQLAASIALQTAEGEAWYAGDDVLKDALGLAEARAARGDIAGALALVAPLVEEDGRAQSATITTDALNALPTNEPATGSDWLARASDLLAEEDPGPTPFLVAELLVDQSLAAIQGKPKTWKTWVELELAVSIVTGSPAFDRFEVAEPGPVILVLEESGRAALHRRLGALARGYAISADALTELHFAANLHVRLDDSAWQERLLAAAKEISPRAIFFDPLARLKMPGRNENAQQEMAVLLDFLRVLRDDSGCAVPFVHHTGHDGAHLRGSSDLESVWESKITLDRSGDVATLSSEHREAEEGGTHRIRQAWDADTLSLKLHLVADERNEEVRARVAAHRSEHPGASANKVFKAIGGTRGEVLEAVRLHDEEGGTSAAVPVRTTFEGKA